MKNKFLFTLSLLLILSRTNAQKFDFVAVEKYWQITDSLRKNIPVNQDSWKSLLSSEGMKLYFQNQNTDLGLDAFKRSMETVYMPKNDSILNVRLKEPEKYYKTFLINEYKTNESKFREYLNDIKRNPNQYLDVAYQNAYSMLPPKMHKKTANTTIYLIPIFTDAVAENNDIITSIFAAYFFDKLKNGALIGHELHHLLRKSKAIKSEKDKFLFSALNMVLHEGSADLIDKKITEKPDAHQLIGYSEYILTAFENPIEKLGLSIEKHINGSEPITEQNVNKAINMSGHVPGYKMALIIERNGLKDEIIKKTDDPISFILTYNKAAKIDKEKPYIFSEQIIQYLKKIK